MDKSISAGLGQTKLSFIHLLGAVLMGVLAAFLQKSSPLSVSPSLFLAAGSVLIYGSVILLGPLPGGASIAAFIACSMALGQGIPAPEASRLFIFAAVVFVCLRRCSLLPPVFTVGIMWLVYLVLIRACFALHGELAATTLTPFSFGWSAIAVGELVSVVVFGLLVCNDRFNAAARTGRSVISSQLLFQHLFALPLVVLAALLVGVLHWNPDMQYDIFSDGYQFSPAIIVALAAALAIVGSLGSFTARLLDRMFDSLALSITNETNLLTEPRNLFTVPSYHCAMTSLRRSMSDVQGLRKQTKELSMDLEHTRRSLKESQNKTASVRLLVDQVAAACLALRMDGKIVAANQELYKLFGINERTEELADYTVLLRDDNVWSKDIEDTLSWACWKLRTLLEEGRQMRYLRSVNGYYLEVYIDVLVNPDFRPPPGSKTLPPAQEVVFLLQLYKHPDLRRFLLQLISPNGLEMLGMHCADMASKIAKQLENVLEHLTVAGAKLTYFKQHTADHPAGKLLGAELSALMERTDQAARTASDTIRQLSNSIEPSGASIENFNLSLHIKHAVDHLCRQLAVEHPPSVVTESDREKLRGAEHAANIPADKCPDVTIQTSPSEGADLITCFLCVVRNMLPEAPDLRILLDYELIGSGTADILTGSLPGRYARIVLRHSGQSIASYMLSSHSAELDLRRNPIEDMESSLTLLRRQIKLLGGFISIQSSTAKGTTITSYIPQSAEHVARLSKKDEREFEVIEVEQHEAPPKKALIVSPDSALLTELAGLVRTRGFFVKLRSPEQLLIVPNNPDVDEETLKEAQRESLAGGQRLGITDFSAQSNQLIGIAEEYSLIIIDAGEDVSLISPLLAQFSECTPGATKLLLGEYNDAYVHEDWIVIPRPLDLEALGQIVESAA